MFQPLQSHAIHTWQEKIPVVQVKILLHLYYIILYYTVVLNRASVSVEYLRIAQSRRVCTISERAELKHGK